MYLVTDIADQLQGAVIHPTSPSRETWVHRAWGPGLLGHIGKAHGTREAFYRIENMYTRDMN